MIQRRRLTSPEAPAREKCGPAEICNTSLACASGWFMRYGVAALALGAAHAKSITNGR